MDTNGLCKGSIVMNTNCKPVESLPKMRRRCKSETLDSSPITKRPPFLNGEKFAVLNANQDFPNFFQRNVNSNELTTRSPKKSFNLYAHPKSDVYRYDKSEASPVLANEVYYNKNFTSKDVSKPLSPYKTQNGVQHALPNYEPKVVSISYEKNNYNSTGSKQNTMEKQNFINYHPKLFQESSPIKHDVKCKEETYKQFCNDVDVLRSKLNHIKGSDAQHRHLESYIKKSIIQANKYKEKVDKSIENANHVLKQNELSFNSQALKSSIRNDGKDPYSNMYGNNRSPIKANTDKAYNFHNLSPNKQNNVLLNSGGKNSVSGHLDPLNQKSGVRRRIRARSESDSTSHLSTDRCNHSQHNTGVIKRSREESPKMTTSQASVNNSPIMDSNSKIEIACNNTLESMTENLLQDLRKEYKEKQECMGRDAAQSKLQNKIYEQTNDRQSGAQPVQRLKAPRMVKRKKKTDGKFTSAATALSDDEQECVMESSDGLGSDSEAACSDSDNNETSFALEGSCDQDTADSNMEGDKLSGCPFIPSLFPNVPPSIAFADHSGKIATMPLNVYRILKWKLTNITPIVVRKTLLNSGFRLLRNTNDWMGTWGKHMKSPCFRALRSHQKINHFPGTFQIGRKDRLWRNMHKCILKFGKREFGFIPRTFVLPQDLKLLRQSWERYSQMEEKWIIKPPASARGTGIRVIQRWSQIPKRKPTVVQKYIARPLLINGSKFDLRLYVLVTSMHPLRIYLYPEGLARFASVKYNVDPSYLSDRYMHLTNYSINKLSTTYKANEDAKACDGHKWTLTSLWKYLAGQGINVQGLWRTLSDLVIRTMVSGESTIQVLSRLNMASRYNCYELFGVDVLLDADLKPWLLEVNISPSLHSASPLDLHVKGPLVKALFNTALYKVPPKLTEIEQQKLLKEYKLEGPLCYDKRLYCTNLSRQEKEKHMEFTAVEKRSVYLYTILENLTPDDVRHLIQAEDELVHCAPLERIFPTATTHHYLQYFEAPRYYNRLFDAWEFRYSRKRNEGIALLQRLCAENVHLEVPLHATVSNLSGAAGCRAPSPLLPRWGRRRGGRGARWTPMSRHRVLLTHRHRQPITNRTRKIDGRSIKRSRTENIYKVVL